MFQAVRSRRGDKGRDDRKFLEAIHYFTLNNVSWRALPAEFGPWDSVWKRFWRLREAGVFEAFFETLASLSGTAHLVQHGQALGRSRGGFSTKIHLKTDFDGHPLAFYLTGGEAGDSPVFLLLLDLGPDVTPRAALTDKGYDSSPNPAAARARGICPVIPTKSNAKNRPKFFPKILYKGRARIEQAFGKLKRFSGSRSAAKRQQRASPASSHWHSASPCSNPSTRPSINCAMLSHD